MNEIRNVCVLVITQAHRLALQCDKHQGYEVLQLPGESPEKFPALVHQLIGPDYARHLRPFGRAVDIIIKSSKTVELVTDIYKVEIGDASNIDLPSNFAWYSKEEVATDPRGRRDARFHLRLLEDRPLDLKFSEEQPEKWIDAKILYWHEDAGVTQPTNNRIMHTDAKQFIGQPVQVTMDRPLGSAHPKHGWVYPVNYGYVPETMSPDGEELDAYVLGVTEPLEQFHGTCIAVIHRVNDNDDKLIVVPEGTHMNDEEIREAIHFQEQFFQSEILR